jgi:uncharacterized membrane protein
VTAAPGAIDAAADAEDGYAPPPVSRMVIAVLALLGLLLSAWLTLYKLGYVGSVQCALGSCERVQHSPWGVFLGLPVAAWGVGGYAAIFAVALAGVQPRWAGARGPALLLFALASGGLAFTAYLTYIEARVINAWCQWCLVSAGIITAIFLLSLPGLRRAR